MKARIIHTKFYESERVLNLSANGRWLFMYFLTCQSIGLTGAFKTAKSRVLFETGLTPKQFDEAQTELSESRLVHFKNNWVVVPSTEEKNNYNNSPVTQKAFDKEFSQLPEEIQQLLGSIDTPLEGIDTPTREYGEGMHTHRNKKTEIRNKKLIEKGGVGEKTYSSIHDLDESDVLEVAKLYQVPESFVVSKLDDMRNWHESTGKQRKNWKSTLKAWVKKDALQVRKEHHGKSKIDFISE